MDVGVRECESARVGERDKQDAVVLLIVRNSRG